jgi:hypothetical protein
VGTERRTDGHVDRETEREKDRETERETERQKDRKTERQRDGKTNMTNLMVAFRTFASKPKNGQLLLNAVISDISFTHQTKTKKLQFN